MTKHEFEEFKLCIARLFDAKKFDSLLCEIGNGSEIYTAMLLDCFGDIAMLWNWWNGRETVTGELAASDVAMMMALLKIARERCGAGKRDNIVDAAAYLALYEEIKQMGEGDETR